MAFALPYSILKTTMMSRRIDTQQQLPLGFILGKKTAVRSCIPPLILLTHFQEGMYQELQFRRPFYYTLLATSISVVISATQA
jgi:hypothetical protein